MLKGVATMFLTAKSKLTGDWLYINAPVQNINVSRHFVEVKMLSGAWESISNLYYSVMITNTPIKVVVNE